MLEFLYELEKYGRIVIFGSFLNSDKSEINDIDIGFIIRDSCKKRAELLIREICIKYDIEYKTRIQNIFAYEKEISKRTTITPLHILYCYENDLFKNHPIIKSLKKGYLMENLNAA